MHCVDQPPPNHAVGSRKNKPQNSAETAEYSNMLHTQTYLLVTNSSQRFTTWQIGFHEYGEGLPDALAQTD